MIAQTRIKFSATPKKTVYLMQEKALADNIAGIFCRQLKEEQMLLNIVFNPP
jgi:hypothetical protein